VGGFVKGDVVVVPFPFSDLSDTKKRPALVIAGLTGDDLILCQITSKYIKDDYSLLLCDDDIIGGSLNRESNIRPNRIFTADASIILYRIGNLNIDKLNIVIDTVIDIFRD